jgi:thiamine biosynthesis lipoprotein
MTAESRPPLLTRRLLVALFVAGALLITVYRVAVGPAGQRTTGTHLTGDTMGTRFSVKLGLALEPRTEASLEAGLRAELDEIIGLMSTYEPDSELSRFNRHRSTEPFAVSEATARVVQDSLDISRASEGAFDVTVGPLVDAWGFGPNGRPERIPTDEELAELRARVGFAQLEVRWEPPALVKRHPELQVDLSAIAKGYAVDRLAEIIEDAGVEDYMVEIGGEVRARGRNPGGEPWRLGVEEPVREQRQVRAVVALEDAGLATSGNYRNSYVRDGVRYAHTLDPVSGRPVQHRLAGVSVLHPRCALADAWATALMVAGPDRALALAEARGLDAYLIVDDGEGGFADHYTGDFRDRVVTPLR